MEVYLLVVGVFVSTGVSSCYWNGQHKIMAISYGILPNGLAGQVSLAYEEFPTFFSPVAHSARARNADVHVHSRL